MESIKSATEKLGAMPNSPFNVKERRDLEGRLIGLKRMREDTLALLKTDREMLEHPDRIIFRGLMTGPLEQERERVRTSAQKEIERHERRIREIEGE